MIFNLNDSDIKYFFKFPSEITKEVPIIRIVDEEGFGRVIYLGNGWKDGEVSNEANFL
jgi:hypothetical protein